MYFFAINVLVDASLYILGRLCPENVTGLSGIAQLKSSFFLFTKLTLIYSVHFQDQTEQPHITKRRKTLATTTTTEEEEEEVMTTAGEDKEEAKDEVGGVVRTATPLCKRFKYSRSVGARTSGAVSIPGRHTALLLLRSGRMTTR